MISTSTQSLERFNVAFSWKTHNAQIDILSDVINNKTIALRLTLLRGLMQICITSVLSSILSRCKYAYTQNFLTFNIYINGIFLQNFMHLGGCVQNLWPFWDGWLNKEKNSSDQNPKKRNML